MSKDLQIGASIVLTFLAVIWFMSFYIVHCRVKHEWWGAPLFVTIMLFFIVFFEFVFFKLLGLFCSKK